MVVKVSERTDGRYISQDPFNSTELTNSEGDLDDRSRYRAALHRVLPRGGAALYAKLHHPRA
jgi:hypothetical protein